jgi:hypothetical protein
MDVFTPTKNPRDIFLQRGKLDGEGEAFAGVPCALANELGSRCVEFKLDPVHALALKNPKAAAQVCVDIEGEIAHEGFR